MLKRHTCDALLAYTQVQKSRDKPSASHKVPHQGSDLELAYRLLALKLVEPGQYRSQLTSICTARQDAAPHRILQQGAPC